ncbi:MAG TPA: phosphatidylserine decarboxylase [Verrucomicrobiae bacterium]|nr:phosphatidylserine decarboxylase [Verrucomicrobiae bacterium]
MKHSGKARKAAFKIVFWTLLVALALLASIVLATIIARHYVAIATAVSVAWVAFAAFTLYFFRDPNPTTPNIPSAIVSPAQGKVDLMDETSEEEFLGGRCRRVSIFLSIIDVHVQRAPITGQLAFSKHKEGRFLSATKSDCGEFNENVLLGFASSELPGRKLSVRLIAGLLARRINVWAQTGETVHRGELIGLIQFGSRVHVYLPLDATVHVKLGDHVKVGETLLGSF